MAMTMKNISRHSARDANTTGKTTEEEANRESQAEALPHPTTIDTEVMIRNTMGRRRPVNPSPLVKKTTVDPTGDIHRQRSWRRSQEGGHGHHRLPDNSVSSRGACATW
jgi:hypothetical protein